MIYFGIKLKQLRTEHELTQDQLGKLVGVKNGTISAYENSSLYPSVEVLIKLTQYFKVSADYLLGLNENKNFEMSGLTDEQVILVTDLIRQFAYLNSKSAGAD